MTRNQTLRVTTAYDWHDLIGLRQSALLAGRNRLRRATYASFMVTNYGRYVAQRVLQVRQARFYFILNLRLKDCGHDGSRANGR